MKKSILILMTIPLFLFSCKKDNTHTVKYTVQGTSKSNITYVDQNGNVQAVANAAANWTTSFTSTDNGLLLKLTVTSADGSPVGGKIYVDGQQEAQDNGSAGSVAISATLP